MRIRNPGYKKLGSGIWDGKNSIRNTAFTHLNNMQFLQLFQTKKVTINQLHDGGVGNCTGVDKIHNYNIFSIKVWGTYLAVSALA